MTQPYTLGRPCRSYFGAAVTRAEQAAQLMTTTYLTTRLLSLSEK